MSDKNEEIEKKVSEQSGISGQRKEVNVENYPEAQSLGQLLKDVNFPVRKEEIMNHVKQKVGTDTQASSIMNNLAGLEDKEYKNAADVTKAMGIVST
ncbi:MAG: DUF2795 domain-containing protein [Nitrososphaeraceae archaeon]|nr:DUF2795 domain-containing protein [Nitrososphaeraceae archaeon]MDW3668353.1 DUF2795 domain-containing protein [Nitrososphaeraceae archaeon]